MSHADARTELAQITRSVRRLLERQDAIGLGDLIARDAMALQRTVGSSTPSTTKARTASPAAAPAAPRPQPSATKPQPSGSSHEPAALDQPATPASSTGSSAVDLFGNPLPSQPAGPTPPASAPAAAAATSAPAFATDYNPRGWEPREAILAASLPVLEQAASEIRACRKCGLCDVRTNAVPGVGSARSGIVFVGEAPGADEDAQGEPFVGRAGQLLTRIIKAMDDAKLIPGMPLTRETVYICNVLKCRPPENRNPLPNEIEQCSPYLLRQLEALKPRVICCLGKFAAELLVGVKGTIGSLRGRVYSFQGAKLLVTYHPAACLRNPGYKKPVWEDMQLLAREYLTD